MIKKAQSNMITANDIYFNKKKNFVTRFGLIILLRWLRPNSSDCRNMELIQEHLHKRENIQASKLFEKLWDRKPLDSPLGMISFCTFSCSTKMQKIAKLVKHFRASNNEAIFPSSCVLSMPVKQKIHITT